MTIVPGNKFGTSLRVICFTIAYMNLIAAIADIACHVVVIAIVSNGFQCDVTVDSLNNINWPWLEPVFFVINLGTHGFYGFPLILRGRYNSFVDYIPIVAEARCYPAMLHVQMIDILTLALNIIWFKFVKEYVKGLHKKETEPMNMFIGISLVKFALQVLFFIHKPQQLRFLNADEMNWFINLLDINLTGMFLAIIYVYTNKLKVEKARADEPPPYIECLIEGVHQTKENGIVQKEAPPTTTEREPTVPNAVSSV